MLDSQIAFELSGEARAEAVFDERRRPHDDERAGAIDEVAPRREERLEHSRFDRLLEQPELHIERMLPGLRRARAGEGSARRRVEPQGRHLVAIGVGGDAEPVGDRQARTAEDRLVRGLGTEPVRVGCVAGRNDEHHFTCAP